MNTTFCLDVTCLFLSKDTSCILAWLIEQGYEVYAFMADVGQEEVRSNPLIVIISHGLSRTLRPLGRKH